MKSVYDGDTARFHIELGFGVILHDQQIRLLGIDAPEVRGEERLEGLASRDALRSKIEGMTVIIKTHKDKQGKYGRWLAEVFIGDLNVNQWMLDNHYAIPYA